MTRFFRAGFWNRQEGAVTVDWVVLCAALVSLSIVVLGSISGSTNSLADKLSGQLASQTISTY